MTIKAKPVDIAEIASKVLILPTETRPKQPSKRLLQEIKGFVADFAKTKKRERIGLRSLAEKKALQILRLES
jgi:hypothetical protein